ncbi:MAG: methionyl-tRNA formyltransferase [Anaerolineae bacterium]|jgi:methionyl-tRNA formyltransferase|nr:methionyl-tRNA formyltransferase [Anaerolineae bacterium]MDH7473357.1 methionyl-tRNA formyltransferase [Anaerolineae bacterium]
MERIVFMGTPRFAVPTLEALATQASYELVCVVTQPDRPAGRGRKLVASPVKEAALARGLPVWQPATLRNPQAVEKLRALSPTLIVIAAFGQILRPDVLAIPPKGCLNVHASLLPRWRGAAPIPAAILAGDKETGVTIMLLDEGMDTGPILAQTPLSIDPADTAGSLTERLAVLGADLLIQTLPRWLAGEIQPRPQDHSQATMCRPLRKEEGWLDWTRPAGQLSRQVRAYNPWPGAYTMWQGQRLKVLRAALVEWHGAQPPGQVITLPEGTAVTTGEGALLLFEVQLAGKRAMSIADFLRGQQEFLGSHLG